jgi:hypothetical protein
VLNKYLTNEYMEKAGTPTVALARGISEFFYV